MWLSIRLTRFFSSSFPDCTKDFVWVCERERERATAEMSYTNRFPPTKNTRYRSSWGPTSVSVFQRAADVPRPSPEEEEFADYYNERLHSAQSRQLIPLQEDLADWINKTISEYMYIFIRCINWFLYIYGILLWKSRYNRTMRIFLNNTGPIEILIKKITVKRISLDLE